MILLTEISAVEEFYRIKLLFERKGILAYYGNQDSARNFGVFHPVGKYAIHIILAEQYEDAKALLMDDTHEVSHPVNLDDYNSETNKSTANYRLIKALLLVLAGLFLALYLLFKYL